MMPLAATLGVLIDEGSKDRVAGKLPVRPEICTAGGIVHGGVIMAFADCLGAVGAFLTLPEGASGTTTIESKTNFLGAGRSEEHTSELQSLMRTSYAVFC